MIKLIIMPLRVLRKNVVEFSDEELLARFHNGGDLKVLGELYSRYMQIGRASCRERV